MPEKIESISRRMIAESSSDQAFWLPAFHSMNGGVFRTQAYDEDYRNGAISAPEDFASLVLYDDLEDATNGGLEIPNSLELDQVEDWFVAKAMKEGLELYAASQRLKEQLK